MDSKKNINLLLVVITGPFFYDLQNYRSKLTVFSILLKILQLKAVYQEKINTFFNKIF